MFGLFKKKNKGAESMSLRGFPGDLSAVKCLIMAAEKSVNIETEVVEDASSISPFGKSPSLTEGDAVAIGAEAALAYMDTRGKGSFNPKKAQLFGHQNYWWQVADSINSDVEGLLHAAAFGATADSDMAKIEAALDALDTALTGKKCIVGEYSFADVHWTAVAHFLELAGKKDVIDARANVSAWYSSMKQRPSASSLPSLDNIKQKQFAA